MPQRNRSIQARGIAKVGNKIIHSSLIAQRLVVDNNRNTAPYAGSAG